METATQNFIQRRHVPVLVVILVVTLIFIFFVGYRVGERQEIARDTVKTSQEKTPKENVSKPNIVVEDPDILLQEQWISKFETYSLSANQTFGTAPFRVTFEPGFVGMGEYWIDFGDGTKENINCQQYSSGSDLCLKMSPVVHLYAKPGFYNATYRGRVGDGFPVNIYSVISIRVR